MALFVYGREEAEALDTGCWILVSGYWFTIIKIMFLIE